MINSTATHPQEPLATQAAVLVHDLSRVYGEGPTAVAALKAISFHADAGTLVAVTGRSGSGKTTLLNLIGGLDTPTSGSILLGGRDISRLSEHERTLLRRHQVAFIFQSYALLPTLSISENVVLAMHISGVSARERSRRAKAVLELVGLGQRLDHRPYELSGGEQERAAIARALSTQAPLILADEPTGELDTATGHEIIGLLTELTHAQGVTVLVATHDPSVVAAADRAYRLADGVLQELEG